MRTDYYTKYRPIGFTYHADAYCYECGVTLPETDPEGNAKHPIAPWEGIFIWDEEWQKCPYPCGQCGADIS